MSWTMPAVVGRYLDAGKPQFFPVSEAEVNRATRFYLRLLDTYAISARSHVLIVSLASKVTAFMPLERALLARHMILSFADSSLFDASRVEMFVRRFDMKAVLGVSTDTLDGLAAAGHDPAEVFKGRIVWAMPDAYDRLAPGDGYTLRRWVEFGPAIGAECAAGSLHVASDDWALDESEDGELLVTSRWSRLIPFDRQPTGYRASVHRTACACGGTDAHVRLAQ